MSELYEKSSRRVFIRTWDHGSLTVDGSDLFAPDSGSDRPWDRRNFSLVGAKNPKWREQIKKNVQAGTAVSIVDTRIDLKPHNAEEQLVWTPGTKGPYGYYGSQMWKFGSKFSYLPWPSLSTTALQDQANNHALTDFISEANAARQVLQSGELIGEFAELTRQVSNPGKSLVSGLRSYVGTVRNRTQRRSVRRLPRHRRGDEQLKIISDTWLEYKFGWSPLISEIDDVIDYVRDEESFMRRDIQAIQGVGIAEDSGWNGSTNSARVEVRGAPGFTARSRDFAKVIVIYRGQVSMSASKSGYIAEKVGFAPDQWLPTLWELVPYSFLADYFANLGDIIYALSFPRSLLPWIMKTVVTEESAKLVDQRPIWYWPESGDLGPTKGSYVNRRTMTSMGAASSLVRRIERTPYNGSLVPDFEFSIPNTGTKWANMAALFVGARYVQKLLK